MRTEEHRCEITVTEVTYRGDRDERTTTFTVSGEGESIPEAIYKAECAASALGYNFPLIMKTEGERVEQRRREENA